MKTARVSVPALLVCLGFCACLSLDGYAGGPGPADSGSGDATSTLGDGALSSNDAAGSPEDDDGADGGGTDGGGTGNGIAFVQANEGAIDEDSLSVVLGRAVTAHDTLIVALTGDGNTTVKSVTDKLGNTFMRAAGAVSTDDINAYLYVAYDAGTADGDGTVIAGTNFTPRASGDGQLVEERIMGAPGATHVTATMTTGLGWLVIAAAFAGK